MSHSKETLKISASAFNLVSEQSKLKIVTFTPSRLSEDFLEWGKGTVGTVPRSYFEIITNLFGLLGTECGRWGSDSKHVVSAMFSVPGL
jgi:hypothetical protein